MDLSKQKRCDMTYTEDDKIILVPIAKIPARERWLHKNPCALKEVQEGLKQSKAGKIRKRSSFAKYTKDDI